MFKIKVFKITKNIVSFSFIQDQFYVTRLIDNVAVHRSTIPFNFKKFPFDTQLIDLRMDTVPMSYWLNDDFYEVKLKLNLDNNSEDQSVDYIVNNFNDVEIIKHSYNYGYSKGYNIVFEKLSKQSEIDYYLLLNNDTKISDPNILNVIIDSTKKYGENNIYSPIITDSNNRLWYGGGKINKVFGY